MPEGSVDLPNRIGPDLVGFYKSEIVDLLTHITKQAVPENAKGGIHNFTHDSSLFNNTIENEIPVVKRELLKSSLRQSVTAFTQEVDEVFDPVIRIRHVISCLNAKRKENCRGKAPIVEDPSILHCKKLKTSSSVAKGEYLVDESRDAEKETDVNLDLKLLLESEHGLVEEILTKHSDELHVTLNHIEKQLEDLLYAVVSKCRSMTQPEKQHLRKQIEKLPARNLDRIVEIFHQGKSSDDISPDKITVDLEKQDNTTLWRLYFYVKAVENARKSLA